MELFTQTQKDKFSCFFNLTWQLGTVGITDKKETIKKNQTCFCIQINLTDLDE